MERTDYRYKAFISYSHKDEWWAKWLKYRLDTFSFKKISDVKHPLREVFLDKYNLSSINLREKGLPDNLQYSKYLICLCTKHYNSEWIELEITKFKQICLERGDKWDEYIIPVCVGKNTDVIPNSIKDIKAVTLNDNFIFSQKELAIALIAAKLLNVENPNNIYNYLHRKYIRKTSFLCALFVLLAAIIAGIWEFSRTRVIYYTDYTEGQYIDGQQPEWIKGIGKIPATAIDTVREYFRFEYKRIPLREPQAGRWQLQRVVHQNVFGNPFGYEEQTTPFVRYPIMNVKYIYRDSMYMPERVECYDEYGNLQRIKQISGDKLDKIDFKNFKTDLSFNQQTLNDFKYPLLSLFGNKYCNITHFDLARDKYGHVNQIIFKASNEKNAKVMSDTRNHIAITLGRDSVGRILAAAFWINDSVCIYNVEYIYTGDVFSGKALRWVREPIEFVDYIDKGNYREKNIRMVDDSVMTCIEYFYQKGRLKQKIISKLFGKCEVFIFYPNGRVVLEDNILYTYNKQGYVIREYHLRIDGTTDYVTSYKYNDKGLVTRVEYSASLNDRQAKAVVGPYGCTSYENFYKDGLLRSQRRYTGANYFDVHYDYDRNKRLISTSYHNADDEFNNLGDFRNTIPNDRVEEQVLSHIVGKMIKNNGNKKNEVPECDTIYASKKKFPFWKKYAKREFIYDDWGNISEIRYYNDREECYIIIKEDILADGKVSCSIGYIINQKRQKYIIYSAAFGTSGPKSID